MASRSDIVVRVRSIISSVEELSSTGKTISRDGIPMKKPGDRFNQILEMFEKGEFKSLQVRFRDGEEIALSISRSMSGTLIQTEAALEQIENALNGMVFDAVSKDKAVQAVQLRFITEARALLDALEERVKQGHDVSGHGHKLIDDLDHLRRQIWLG